ncbi:hypothetical protein B0G76_4943 [Paraburkholderia sp. BL23I1N1]|nr:hypothetical protein B0G76_4943 [Paraburkholderia sp. BL23I1N1]
MGTIDRPLRSLVKKWLGPTPAMPARVTQFGRMPSNRGRYICVEALRPSGALTIYFFLHDDGTWRVFPPDIERPAMNASWCAAA